MANRSRVDVRRIASLSDSMVPHGLGSSAQVYQWRHPATGEWLDVPDASDADEFAALFVGTDLADIRVVVGSVAELHHDGVRFSADESTLELLEGAQVTIDPTDIEDARRYAVEIGIDRWLADG